MRKHRGAPISYTGFARSQPLLTTLPLPTTAAPLLATTQVRDAFGLPLEASEAFFFTTDPTPGLAGPQVAAGGTAMVLEPPSDASPLLWPVASRGRPKYESDPVSVAAWAVNKGTYASALSATSGAVSSAEGDDGPAAGSLAAMKRLGAPRASLTRGGGGARVDIMELSGAPGLQVVAQARRAGVYSEPTLVSQTHLQFASAVVGTAATFWVADARGAPPPPVKGAEVSTHLASYGAVSFFSFAPAVAAAAAAC